MTAPNGAIIFNNVTGSDTAASGLGPAVAVTGSGASTTGASNVVTGINTAGVSSGDLLWVQSSSGRQFSIITTVDSGAQVTCDDNFDNTESGRTWAIGGKRATWDNSDSRVLWSSQNIFNINNSMLVEIKTETDQSLTSPLVPYSSFNLLFTSDNRSTISTTGDFSAIDNPRNYILFIKNLKFLCGSTSSTSAGITGEGQTLITDCTVGEDGGSNNFRHGILVEYATQVTAHRCQLYGKGISDTSGFGFGGSNGNINFTYLSDSYVKDFYYGYRSPYRTWSSVGNVFSSCGYGIYSIVVGGPLEIRNTIFHNLTEPAFFTDNLRYVNLYRGDFLYGCVFVDCQDHLLRCLNGGVFYGGGGNKGDFRSPFLNTLYSYNSSNTFDNFPEFQIYNLTADPFVDAANGDFNINNASGGGAVLRSTKYTLGG